MSRRASMFLLAALAAGACSRHSEDRSRDVRLSGGPVIVRSAAQLLAAAETTYSREEYDSARTALAAVLHRAEATHDSLTLARALTWSGLAAWHLGDYPAARAFDQRALYVEDQARLAAVQPWSYNALGLLVYHEGRFGAAIDAYERAAHGARTNGDCATLAKALGNEGLVYSDIGEFGKADVAIGALRRFGHDSGHVDLEANALGNLGMVRIRAGDPRAAMPLLDDALRMHRSTGSAVGEEDVLGQLVTAYDAMGEPQLALAYLDSALTIAERDGLKQQESDDLQLIADLYDESGDHTRALAYLSRAAVLADRMGTRKIQGDIAGEQARALFALGDTAHATALVLEALGFHADAGVKLEQIDDELLLAEIEQRRGATPAANEALRNARQLTQTLGTSVARAELAIGEARIAELQHDPAHVLRIIRGAQADLRASTTGREWEANAFAARADAALGRLSDAIRSGHAAMEEVERVRSS